MVVWVSGRNLTNSQLFDVISTYFGGDVADKEILLYDYPFDYDQEYDTYTCNLDFTPINNIGTEMELVVEFEKDNNPRIFPFINKSFLRLCGEVTNQSNKKELTKDINKWARKSADDLSKFND